MPRSHSIWTIPLLLVLIGCAQGPSEPTDAETLAANSNAVPMNGSQKNDPPKSSDGSVLDATSDGSLPPQQVPDAAPSDAGVPAPSDAGVRPTGFRCRWRAAGSDVDSGGWFTGLGGNLPTVTLEKFSLGGGPASFVATYNKHSHVLTIRATPANASYEAIGLWTIGINDERTVVTNQPGSGNILVGCWVSDPVPL
jgi:hypothetical protein